LNVFYCFLLFLLVVEEVAYCRLKQGRRVDEELHWWGETCWWGATLVGGGDSIIGWGRVDEVFMKSYILDVCYVLVRTHGHTYRVICGIYKRF